MKQEVQGLPEATEEPAIENLTAPSSYLQM